MTHSEEKAAEKFTLHYYVKNPKVKEVQTDLVWCLNFATEAHKDQKRKDKEKTPYINHPIGVAYILSEETDVTNLNLIRGCLLHDTVEDTAVVIEMITAKFGEYVGNLVQEVTDDKSLPKQKRKDLQIVHARSSSPQAKMVKLADKLYNLRDLERALPEGWSEERRENYYKWAYKVCEGLRGISPILEEKLDEIFIKKGLVFSKENHKPVEKLPWMNHDELKPLIKAANFAAVKHSRHFVLDTTNSVPYINHVVAVAFLVSQEAEVQDIPVLCAALLHAVVGKANTSIQEVMDVFGGKVGELVDELTWDHSLPFEQQFKSQGGRVPNMSYHAKIIMLAVVIDTCRRLEVLEPLGWSQEMREKYFKWAYQLSSLLANTHPQLERELNDIWVGQGLKEFKMQPKKNLDELQ